jgi:hypothetical protein
MTLDFPTFERPKKATTGRDGDGNPSEPITPVTNCTDCISIKYTYAAFVMIIRQSGRISYEKKSGRRVGHPDYDKVITSCVICVENDHR